MEGCSLFTNRCKNIIGSKSLEINSKIKNMIENGNKVISFVAGQPDFNTPEDIKKIAKASIDNNFTKYTQANGILSLRKTTSEWMNNICKTNYTHENIIISNGCKQSIFNILQILVEMNDEVLIPSPYWLSYPELVKMSSAIPIFIYPKKGYKVTSEDIEKKINNKTKLLILNNPCNPSGVLYTQEELLDILEVCKKYNIYILSDEIYNYFIYDNNKFISIASLDKKYLDMILIVNGISKTFSMTGFRIGFTCGNNRIIKKMSIFQSHSTGNACSISQIASEYALKKQDKYYKSLQSYFQEKKDLICLLLSQIKELKFLVPCGSFYVFPDVSYAFGKKHNDIIINNVYDLVDILLKCYNISVLPGSYFGMSNNIRISFATHLKNIQSGMSKLFLFFKNLR